MKPLPTKVLPRRSAERLSVDREPSLLDVTPTKEDRVIPKDMSDDAADVQRVLAGDVEAYAALVDRYYDRCARFAIRMLGNRDDAEDALQATFLRAYRALNRYQERDRFSAWLYRILVNQCRRDRKSVV